MSSLAILLICSVVLISAIAFLFFGKKKAPLPQERIAPPSPVAAPRPESARDVARTRFLSNMEGPGDLANKQLQRAVEKFRDIDTASKAKLSEAEPDLARLQKATQEAYFSVLDNLKEISTTLLGISGMETVYAQETLKALQRDDSADPQKKESVEALKGRLDQVDQRLEKAQMLLALNEEALADAERAGRFIGSSGFNVDEAVREFESIAKRTKKTNIQ